MQGLYPCVTRLCITRLRIMRVPGTPLLWAGVFSSLVFFAGQAKAQIANGNLWPKPRLTVLTPTGGRAGTSFEVAFTGTELDDPQGLYFSHPGITATPVLPPPAAASKEDKDSLAKGNA